jgi:hypothetical protein
MKKKSKLSHKLSQKRLISQNIRDIFSYILGSKTLEDLLKDIKYIERKDPEKE